MANRLSLLSLLNESPDMVYTNKKTFHYMAKDAIPFGYYKGKLYIGGLGSIHPHIYVPAFKDNPVIQGTRNFKHDRTFFKLAGRIWMDSGIISFWDYPTVPELNQFLIDFDKAMLDEFGKETNFHNNMGNMWIELVSESDAKEINDMWGGKDGSEESSKLIPLLKYNGTGVWGDEERNRSHTEIGSGGKEVPDGFGSRKEVPGEGHSNVEKRFKMGEALETNNNAINNLKVYHGTNIEFNKISLKYSYQGILWFTDNIEKIKGNEHGGRGNKIILTGNLTLLNPAGWDEYEKYGIGQLKDLGYDGVVLSDGNGYSDYIVFNVKSIKNVKRIKSTNEGITESPDRIEKIDIGYYETDAIPFGYFGKKLYIGPFRSTHGDIKIPNHDTEKYGHIRRHLFKYAGRIWLEKKLISFWEYPNKNDLFRILRDISMLVKQTYDIDINPNDILIECIPKEQKHVFNAESWNANSIFVSPEEYQGGYVWDPDIKDKDHLKVGKGGEAVVNGFGSRKNVDTSNTKSGTEAERRFKMKQSESMELDESPDNVLIPGKSKPLSYSDRDGVAFGYIDGKMVVGRNGLSHGQVAGHRDKFKYAGRVWLDSKVISFWEYPSSSVLQTMLKDLADAMDEKFDNDYGVYRNQDKYFINVIPKEKAYYDDNGKFVWYKSDDDGIIIPIKDYQGSVTWGDNNDHIKVGKGGSNVPDGFGSKHNIDTSNTKSGTDAERRFKMGEIFKNK